MKYLEQLLSPIRTNLANIEGCNTQGCSINDHDNCLVQKIKDQKIGVMEKKILPSEANLIRPEIMESWLRCFEYGLDPLHYNYPPMMDEDEFAQRLKDKTFFLEAAEPYFCQFEKMLFDMGCYIFLSDENGTMLRISNTLKKNKFWLKAGSVWTEEGTGTCAHDLSIRLKSPIQVCGPEHFSQIFKHISCSSAPVYNACGELEGTLSISSSYLHSQSSHTLGLVVTIANAIQKEFQLSEKKMLLNVALSAAHDAVVVIDADGTIVAANSNAKKLFSNDLEGGDIHDILDDTKIVKDVIRTGMPVEKTNIFVMKGKQKINLSSIRPAACSSSSICCVLNFEEETSDVCLTKKRRYESTKYTFSRVVGSSEKIQEAISLAREFVRFDNNILLQGESGTGKEVFAQSMHNERLPDGPFIAVNCAAIPGSLIESELFGYEAGAFTGAERKGKQGKIELANGGTLFLDEIGDMPLELQAVLLRVLEDKLIMRIGGSRYIPVDFKLVAATNRSLIELVKEKKFREDLYYRLSVFNINIAPLRERGSDIIELADYFLSHIAQTHKMPRPLLTQASKYYLLHYDWPGNVRQLQNAIAYAFCRCKGDSIQSSHLPNDIVEGHSLPEVSECVDQDSEEKVVEAEDYDGHNMPMKEIEKILIRKALGERNNHVRAAAKALGISKSTIYRKIKEYDISI